MDTLQAELETTYPILNIQIVGLNEFGQDPAGANDLMMANRTTPWLQDGDSNGNQTSDVWYDRWDVTYRDVMILNGQNEMVDVYNLTSNDLGVAANYATMRDKLLDAAMTEQKPWQNHSNRFDINDDGFIVPGDVLAMINEIEVSGPRNLPPPTTASLAAYWDCSGDNYFSPLDILQVINFIEEAHAEGEASAESGPDFAAVAFAFPESISHSSANTELITTQIVDAATEVTVEAIRSLGETRIDAPTADRQDSLEPASDDFWADYWPLD